jgi:hypothetical protein
MNINTQNICKNFICFSYSSVFACLQATPGPETDPEFAVTPSEKSRFMKQLVDEHMWSPTEVRVHISKLQQAGFNTTDGEEELASRDLESQHVWIIVSAVSENF